MQAALAPSIQQTQQDARNKGLSLQGAYGAAAAQAEPLAGQVGQTFSNAAGAEAAFAKGFSDHVQATLGASADQSNTLLAQNNSPQHVNAASVGDTLYGLGGYNPASVLNTSGAAFKAAAQQLPTTLRGVGVQGYQGALNEGTANVAKLEAQRPGLVQTALAGLKADQLDRAKFAYTKQSDARDYALREKQFGQQMALDLAKFQEDKNQFGATYALDKWKASQPDYQVVGSSTSGYQLWDKGSGTFSPIPGMGPSSSTTKLSYSELKQAKTDAADTAKAAFMGAKLDPNDPNGKRYLFGAAAAKAKGDWVVEPQHYQQAMADLLNHNVPLGIARAALNRYWTKPGYDYDIAQRKAGQFVPARATKGYGRPLSPTPTGTARGKAGAAAEPAAYQSRSLAAVNAVKEYLGTPYSWGGGGPDGPSYGIGRGAQTKGFDCSALIQYAWAKEGVQIPRVTYAQWKTGRPVSKGSLQPGDAVFFNMGSSGPEHVGMYLGDGQFIEAPHTGANVRISNLKGRSDYVGARRYA